MKARTRKTPWLLITLLVGFLAAAGVALVLHHHSHRLLVSADGIVPPDDTPALQTDTTTPIAMDEEQPSENPTGAAGDHHLTAGKYSNSTQTDAANDSIAPTTAPDLATSTSTNQPTEPTVDSSGGSQPQSNRPSSGDTTSPPPATGNGEFANAGYTPFGCGVAAGCGGGGSEIVRSSGSSGGTPSLHNSQGTGPQTDNSDPQTDNSGQPTDNSDPNGPGSGNPGQKSDPSNPGSSQPVAAAPELDSATLAGALTLLLGSLAIVRSRRVRATTR